MVDGWDDARRTTPLATGKLHVQPMLGLVVKSKEIISSDDR
jgi:hypothetical protein